MMIIQLAEIFAKWKIAKWRLHFATKRLTDAKLAKEVKKKQELS